MDWNKILSDIGIVGIISGLLVWLIKQLGQLFIDKNLSLYRQELQNKSDIYKSELNHVFEKYKAELAFLSQKAFKLHDKRLEKIDELYSRIVDLQMSMLKLTNPIKFTTDYEAEMEKLIETSNNDFQTFSSFFEKNKIYFNDTTCILIEEIRKTIHTAIWNFHEHRMYKQMGEDDRQVLKEARQNMIKAYNTVKDDIPKLRQNIETDFRKILSVD